MTNTARRKFLGKAGAAAGMLGLLPQALHKALAIEADSRTGTIKDVDHIVILTQENRSFDHYFGALRGVRGFGDRFPWPLILADAGSGAKTKHHAISGSNHALIAQGKRATTSIPFIWILRTITR